MAIRIGILGYGNLGRGVECAIKHNDDMELKAVFTRRAPATVGILTDTAEVHSVNDLLAYKDEIDVLIICGGSATDLPVQTPEYAKYFNVIDSFDTHAKIPEHFENVNRAATESGKVGIISVGWDPGMFSLNRVYANAILTNGIQILILNGVLPPGSQMPSVRQLATELSVNPNTIQRAYMELEKLGLIYPVKGRGNFVADSSQVQKINRESYRKEFTALIQKGKNTGFSREELEKMLAETFEKEDES